MTNEKEFLGANKLYVALIEAQRKANSVKKEAFNNFQKYGYASAESVFAEAKEVLGECGLAVFPSNSSVIESDWKETGKNPARATLLTTWLLIHESGESMVVEGIPFPIVPQDGRPMDKAMAGALTTARSYFLQALLNLERTDKTSSDDAKENNKAGQDVAGRNDSGKSEKEILLEEIITKGIKKGVDKNALSKIANDKYGKLMSQLEITQLKEVLEGL